ncbi:MFS transporter [Kocuria himachalensis]
MTHVNGLDRVGTPDAENTSLNTKSMRRIIASAFFGNLIEYYDFLLYATASAVVFSQVFFNDLPPAVGVFASFGTLAAGYLARPLGGAVFGHFGDKYGRKEVLIASMVLMGISTTLVGLIPSPATIGVMAPILLVTLRLLQGFAVGGELGGSMLLVLEHAPAEKRGFAASFANMGAAAGGIFATLAIALVSLLPEDQFVSWGWRIPFLFSVLLLGVGYLIRRSVTETPVFANMDKTEATDVPLVAMFKHNGKNLLSTVLSGMSLYAIAGVTTVWGLSRAIEAGVERTDALLATTAGSIALVVSTVISAKISDRLGRRKVMLTGAVLILLSVPALLWLIDSGSVWLYALAVVWAQAVEGLMFGPYAAFVGEQFPTRVRYTGASLSYQFSSIIGGGLAPLAAAGLVVFANGSTMALGVVWALTIAITVIAIYRAEERRSHHLEEIK